MRYNGKVLPGLKSFNFNKFYFLTQFVKILLKILIKKNFRASKSGKNIGRFGPSVLSSIPEQWFLIRKYLESNNISDPNVPVFKSKVRQNKGKVLNRRSIIPL